MALSISQKGKGRFRPDDSLDLHGSSKFSSRSSSSSSASSFSSSSGSESESEHSADDSEDEDEEEEEVTQEYLDSLLEKARASIAEKAAKNNPAKDALNEDIIKLDDLESEWKCVFRPQLFRPVLIPLQRTSST